MHAVVIICKKELRSFFDSLFAYILLALFIGITGFFTWMSDSDIFRVGQTSLYGFYSVAYWSVFFFTAALTIRMLTEERKTKADELSSTKSASSMQIVLGKFFGALTLVAIALLFTLPYVFTLAYLGNLDQGEVMGGYLALLLMAGAYISIGLLASSITSNQVLSSLLAITMSLFFHIIFEVLAAKITGLPSDLVTYLTMSAHFESMVRGILDTRDILYFLTIICIGLILTELYLTKRNILN